MSDTRELQTLFRTVSKQTRKRTNIAESSYVHIRVRELILIVISLYDLPNKRIFFLNKKNCFFFLIAFVEIGLQNTQ